MGEVSQLPVLLCCIRAGELELALPQKQPPPLWPTAALKLSDDLPPRNQKKYPTQTPTQQLLLHLCGDPSTFSSSSHLSPYLVPLHCLSAPRRVLLHPVSAPRRPSLLDFLSPSLIPAQCSIDDGAQEEGKQGGPGRLGGRAGREHRTRRRRRAWRRCRRWRRCRPSSRGARRGRPDGPHAQEQGEEEEEGPLGGLRGRRRARRPRRGPHHQGPRGGHHGRRVCPPGEGQGQGQGEAAAACQGSRRSEGW